MNPIKNPFAPGAGTQPPALVGRDNVLEDARILFARVQNGRPEKSMILTGLRGVGKTVLLNAMERQARELHYKTIVIEAPEDKSFTSKLTHELRKLLFYLNLKEGSKEKIRQAFNALRNFIGTLQFSYGDFGMSLEPQPGIADSGVLEIDLPELFVAVAEAAADKSTAVALFIDEIQNITKEELAALIMAMHKLQQIQAPLVLIGAGLPTIPRLAGDAKSYAERLFAYPKIGQLSTDQATLALRNPVRNEGVDFEPSAINEIVKQTQGYPYFIQEWGSQVWNHAKNSPINLQDVTQATQRVIERLDENFFRVRYDRLTDSEKRFMRAMASLSDQESKSSEVADYLNTKPSNISLIRASLMEKGMIYSPRHGVLDYSVPCFGDFMRRTIPNFKP